MRTTNRLVQQGATGRLVSRTGLAWRIWPMQLKWQPWTALPAGFLGEGGGLPLYWRIRPDLTKWERTGSECPWGGMVADRATPPKCNEKYWERQIWTRKRHWCAFSYFIRILTIPIYWYLYLSDRRYAGLTGVMIWCKHWCWVNLIISDELLIYYDLRRYR